VPFPSVILSAAKNQPPQHSTWDSDSSLRSE
jgi:hypothetical protein